MMVKNISRHTIERNLTDHNKNKREIIKFSLVLLFTIDKQKIFKNKKNTVILQK